MECLKLARLFLPLGLVSPGNFRVSGWPFGERNDQHGCPWVDDVHQVFGATHRFSFWLLVGFLGE